jgi:hypothetical protein
MSSQAKDVPITILAYFEFVSPSLSTIWKYCKVSMANENTNTASAVIKYGKCRNDLKKQ